MRLGPPEKAPHPPQTFPRKHTPNSSQSFVSSCHMYISETWKHQIALRRPQWRPFLRQRLLGLFTLTSATDSTLPCCHQRPEKPRP